MSKRPKKPMCPLCVQEQGYLASAHIGDGVWLHTCTNTANHGTKPYSWQESPDDHDDAKYGGLAEEWGVYDDLLACFTPGEPFIEYGIVEYRYKQRNPGRYALLVNEYGHTAGSPGPSSYTASKFLAGRLGEMFRRGDLLFHDHDGKGTGRWQYNNPASYWALAVAEPSTESLTWAEFATSAGLDPETWTVSR